MEFHIYIAYALAGVMLITLLRVLWSTSGRQLAEYREALVEGQRAHEKLMEDVQRIEEARNMLRSANVKLNTALREKDAEIASQHNEIRALKKNLDNQRAANATLNEIIGNQELKITQLSTDVEMMKGEITKLRAQLGLAL